MPNKTIRTAQYQESETHIVCPWHGYEYNIKTGEHPGHPGLKLRRATVMVRDGDGPLWAWLGGRTSLDLSTGEYLQTVEWGPSVKVAFGEPGRGLAGWRLTHRQANATWPIAQRGGDTVVRYSDVALWASVMRDDVLMASLRQLYVEPLMAEQTNESHD